MSLADERRTHKSKYDVGHIKSRKIERALAFHVTRTSPPPEPFLAPALRGRPPPAPALQFLPTVRAPHTPTLAIFLIHVTRPVSSAIAPLILSRCFPFLSLYMSFVEIFIICKLVVLSAVKCPEVKNLFMLQSLQ
jgi:hypothetical protein